MIVLGIESSCDDMAAAVVEGGKTILSSVVSSQDDIHERYGGIVPELASRRHIETVVPVVEEAVRRSGRGLNEIEGIGVTMGPGLLGSLLVGLSFAKALAYGRKIPFVGVNHIVAHPLAAFLNGGEKPAFPFIALVVSGGHTTLFRYESFTSYEVLGQTRDDAAGEAFDKVAKLLGFTYPGGVVIDRLAREGNRDAVPFKRPYISKESLDFSFSGIKTAVMNHIRGLNGGPSEGEIRDVAASFQEAVVDVLVRKAFAACRVCEVENLVLAGGVACNSRLRERLRERGEEEGVKVFIPPPNLCSDNGAVIAASGYHILKGGRSDDISLDADPNIEY
jgi:N6-L-threonylcarbamoyladenine synthase